MRYLAALLLFLVGCGASSILTQNDATTNANAPACGNEIVEVGEQCDEGTQNSDTAPNACRTTCHLPGCGDNVIDTGEECEGFNLSGNTCQSFGYTKGVLSCSPDTCTFDLSGCSRCGNEVAEGTDAQDLNYEVCDGTDLRGQTCESLGLESGDLACTQDCGLDTSGCVATPECGDGVAEAQEACDGSDLQGQTCEGLGQDPGVLACSNFCTFDVSGCGGLEPECGNNLMEAGELCDGTDLGGADCTTVGFPQGVLACSPTCTYDISACYTPVPVCGNGTVEQGEECDDGNHSNADACPDGPGGTCQNASCGDGFVWAGVEGCDDGNGINEDICPDGPGGTCEIASCGDGFVFTGAEICDTALDPVNCHPGCQTMCGDGIRQSQYEVCDVNENYIYPCHPDCQSRCGDYIVQSQWEDCDPPSSATGCNDDCSLSACGDGVCETGETAVSCPLDCGCTLTGCWAGYAYTGECCAEGLCVFRNRQNVDGTPIENCGACGVDCPAGQYCSNGACY